MKRLFLCMERELIVVKERYGNYETAYHLQNMQPTCIAVDPFHTQVLLSLNLKNPSSLQELYHLYSF